MVSTNLFCAEHALIEISIFLQTVHAGSVEANTTGTAEEVHLKLSTPFALVTEPAHLGLGDRCVKGWCSHGNTTVTCSLHSCRKEG